MLIVMVRIPVGSREESERMVERFRNRAGLVDGMSGFLGFELLQGDGELISLTRWASRQDLDNWTNSEANAQAHARLPRPTGGGHPEAGQHAHAPHQPHQAHARQPQQTGGHTGPQGSSVMVYEVVIPAGTGS
jgi:heme-degrading monooxygenase HmoA